MPEAESTLLPPEQMVTFDPALIVGKGFTVTLAELLLLPQELVAVTEYPVEEVGETTIEEALLPVFQT